MEEHDEIIPNEGPCFDREGGKELAFAIKSRFYSDGLGSARGPNVERRQTEGRSMLAAWMTERTGTL